MPILYRYEIEKYFSASIDAHSRQCKERQYRNCNTHSCERKEFTFHRQGHHVCAESKDDYGAQAGGTCKNSIIDGETHGKKISLPNTTNLRRGRRTTIVQTRMQANQMMR